MTHQESQNRNDIINVLDVMPQHGVNLTEEDHAVFDDLALCYRTLCGLMFNFVPTSGHPGGSLSCTQIVLGLQFQHMLYDLAQPLAQTNDLLVYAAGHKAMGLYAMLALRDDLTAQHTPDALPADLRARLRLEDLLGFRRNPTQPTPLFKQFQSKALDGHPGCNVPFVPITTGASGVGLGGACGLAFAARDLFGNKTPWVHVVEGEAGLTPGRAQEALAAAATMGLSNLMLHLDFNQASIDSDRVCKEDDKPGDYVQWTPESLCALHGFRVIHVPDGHDMQQVLTAQAFALNHTDTRPTAIVYHTVKGKQYGIEGRKSHGAGHGFCSDAFKTHVLEPVEQRFQCRFPSMKDTGSPEALEQTYWNHLKTLADAWRKDSRLCAWAAKRVNQARENVENARRTPRANAPQREVLDHVPQGSNREIPAELICPAGSSVALREQLGKVLRDLNRQSHGALVIGAADLYGSTSVSIAAADLPSGFYHATQNPDSRLLSLGGICEDLMGAFQCGVSAFGAHIGVSSSYSAFIAAMQHTAARLHAIGQQTRREAFGVEANPFIMVNGHAGVKTGEDGPTHADPQALQLLCDNFPQGSAITLTPLEPNEIAPLLRTALDKHPSLIAPFVTRPSEEVPDREALELAPATACTEGLYKLCSVGTSSPARHALLLQGSDVGLEFLRHVWPDLKTDQSISLDVYYLSSLELFDLLTDERKEAIFPEELARNAMAISGFTLAPLERFLFSNRGRKASLYPFKKGHYLGSGQAEQVMVEAGLDGQSQHEAILRFVRG